MKTILSKEKPKDVQDKIDDSCEVKELLIDRIERFMKRNLGEEFT